MLDIVDSPSDTNISLEGSAYFYIYGYHIDTYDCSGFEAHWEIQRADGNIEVYTVLNDTYHYHRYLPIIMAGAGAYMNIYLTED